MKITKTVTSHAYYNYGALLQAFSLQNYLLSNGIENEIIDIRYPTAIGRYPIFMREFNLKSIMTNFIKSLNLFSIISYRKNMQLFLKNNLKMTKTYYGFEDILKDVPRADYYICGSDQIWNVKNKINKAFFLEFVNSGKKISYAPSIATRFIDDYCENYFKEQLASFYAISVREKSGLKLLEDMGIDAVTCIDPVFLNSREFWEEKCKASNKCTPKNKYILVYSLSSSPLLEKAISELSNKKGLPVYVITINGFTRIKNAKRIIKAGPLEFLNLIMNAEYVVSSSFHGLAFSIIFGKKMLAYANSATGSRTEDMLSLVGLENNLITKDMDVSVADNIDFEKTKELLNREISKSKKFLMEALDEQYNIC